MSLPQIRAEIKNWEREFKNKHNRVPNPQDIRNNAEIATKYKLYKKLKAGTDSATTRARKRLRGDPTSPSPKKVKREFHIERAEEEIDAEEEAIANSPIKQPTRGNKPFKLLFDEVLPSMSLFGSSPSTSKNTSSDNPDWVLGINELKRPHPDREPIVRQLLAPSPPPPDPSNKGKSAQGRKKPKLDIRDEPDSDEDIPVKLASRPPPPRHDDLDDDLFHHVSNRIAPDEDRQQVEINLPATLHAVLALDEATKDTEDQRILEGLLYGRRKYDADHGGEIWGVGEEADDDEWESEGVPWERADL